MQVRVFESKQQLGEAAAADGAEIIRQAIALQGRAAIIVATGASQFDTLAALVRAPDIAWDRVTAFHLDEYVGLPITHPASFRKYLWERFVSRLPLPPMQFHYIEGDASSAPDECARLAALIGKCRIDAAFVGIGENGHLALNDPPADFQTDQPYLVVNLDDACRRQQLGEGWFPTLGDVPARAISMSVRQIMKSRAIICCVPDERKARAVKACLSGPVSNAAPASVLQQHDRCTVYLDRPAASLLSKVT